MKVRRTSSIVGIAAITALGLAACGSNNSGSGGSSTNAANVAGCASGTLNGQGSTFQQNAEQEWASKFGQQCSGAHINYQGTGSSSGIEAIDAGTDDFAGSDATMATDEQSKADSTCGSPALTIPITAGGVAVIYNLPDVKDLQLSATTLAGIFDGSIKKWNDPAVAKDNPGVKLPSTTVAPYHRNDGSGTTKVFTGFLQAVAPSDWKLGSDKTITWPSGSSGANGSDGVTAAVKQTTGAITYAEVTFATSNGLPTAKVKGASGGYEAITGDNVAKAIQSGFTVTGTGSNLAGTLDFTKMQGYPISTVTYAIVCSKYKDAAKGKLVKNYFGYVVGSGQQAVTNLGFAPLPSDLLSKASTAFASIS